MDVTVIDRTEPGYYLLGAGGHGLVVAEAALAAGLRCLGFFDDRPAADLAGMAFHHGALTRFLEDPDPRYMLGFGNLATRAETLRCLPAAARIVVHPSAVVSPSAHLDPGAFVGPLAVVHARASVGPHAIVNSGAIVEHDSVIGANSHVAPGAVLGGAVQVGTGTLIGLGARVLPGTRIGAHCVVACGSVVVKTVPDFGRVAGVPARPMADAGQDGQPRLESSRLKRHSA